MIRVSRPTGPGPFVLAALAALGLASLALAPASARATAPEESDGYGTIADALASPLFKTFDEATKGYEDTAVMVRLEMARKRLRGMSEVPPTAARVRDDALGYLDACGWSLEELRRLNSQTPDVEGIATKALEASPALLRERDPETGARRLTPEDEQALGELAVKTLTEVFTGLYNGWQSWTEWDKYQANYRSARRTGLALSEIAAARCSAPRRRTYGIGLKVNFTDDGPVVEEAIANGPAARAGIVAGDRLTSVEGRSPVDRENFLQLRGAFGSRARLTVTRDGAERALEIPRTFMVEETPVLRVDLDGSWARTFQSDMLYLRNVSGQDLTDCTLVIRLEGTHGESDEPNGDTHLHYVRRWPAGEERIARYVAAGTKGIANDESVDNVTRVTIELYSDQVRNTATYDYVGTSEFDKDVESYFTKTMPKFYLTFSGENFLSDAGVWITHDSGLSSFPDPYVTVKLIQGTFEKSIRFRSHGGRWSSGYFGGQSLKSEEFNGIDPDSVEVTLEFLKSSYKHTLTWRLK